MDKEAQSPPDAGVNCSPVMIPVVVEPSGCKDLGLNIVGTKSETRCLPGL